MHNSSLWQRQRDTVFLYRLQNFKFFYERAETFQAELHNDVIYRKRESHGLINIRTSVCQKRNRSIGNARRIESIEELN